jgi:hypothetical protein
MNKPTKSFWMLGTLALALSAAPLFAQQPDANSTSSTPSAQSQQPAQPGTPPSSQQPGATDPSQSSPSQQPGASQPPAGQAGPDAQAQSASEGQTFSGTVSKSGDKYVLQDASGKTYDVDRQEELKKYEGKQVRIKGTLDPDGKTIHVK